MLVYIAATLISCLLAVWCEKRNTDALNAIDSKQRWGALVLCSLPLILVSAARWGVGTDFLYTYLPEFRALQWLAVAMRCVRSCLRRCAKILPGGGCMRVQSLLCSSFWVCWTIASQGIGS